MALYVFPLLLIAVIAFVYKIYCQVTVELIEKKKLSTRFWLVLSFMCFIPLTGTLRNTSATLLATRGNLALCIAYACIILVLLSDTV